MAATAARSATMLSGVRRWILSFATSPHSASHGNVVYTSIDEPVFWGLCVQRLSFRAPSSRLSETIVRRMSCPRRWRKPGSRFAFSALMMEPEGQRALDARSPVLLPGPRLPAAVNVPENYPQHEGMVWDEQRRGFRVEWVSELLLAEALKAEARSCFGRSETVWFGCGIPTFRRISCCAHTPETADGR